MADNVQESILKTIDILVNDSINKSKFTSSNVGIIVSVAGFDCLLKIGNDTFSCTIPEHLHDWIQKDDIVVVQDLYSDNNKKIITGKIGTSRTTSFTFFDTEKGRTTSGIDGTIDSNSGKIDDVILEVE